MSRWVARLDSRDLDPVVIIDSTATHVAGAIIDGGVRIGIPRLKHGPPALDGPHDPGFDLVGDLNLHQKISAIVEDARGAAVPQIA